MEFEVEVEVCVTAWTQFMLTLLMTLLNYFPENFGSSYQPIKKLVNKIYSFRESCQHMNNPFHHL